ncbi:MAG TPA: response regulator [Pyrinomonadaceae bacterium]|nr:response regulator [Pyrinomonadaceae bacterium]
MRNLTAWRSGDPTPLHPTPWASNNLSASGDDGHRAEALPSLDGEDVGGAKPRALVVDDAPDVTEMIAMLLRYGGYDVVTVFNATDAFDAARGEQFDVVVSDIGMPGMNGYQLAEALRALPAYKAVPLIAVTGFAMYDDRERALDSGFDAFLTKPINPMDLIDLVKRLHV